MNGQNSSETTEDKNKYIAVFSAILIVLLLAIIFRHSAVVRGIAIIVFGGPLAVVGWFVGRAIRNFVMPDFVMTTGGFTGLLKTKLFWMFGPQLIGVLVALILANGIVQKVFPPPGLFNARNLIG